MVDIPVVMATLASERPVYRYEADFRRALERELRRRIPEAEVLPKHRMQTDDEPMHLDLLLIRDDERLAVELRYKTRGAELVSGGEKYQLGDHRAQDHGRYDFLKDVTRLERIVQSEAGSNGCAILLTNDHLYWSPRRRRQTFDAEFSLDEGRKLSDEVKWREGASPGTTRGRESPLRFRGAYPLHWHDFWGRSDVPGALFRYLAVEVPGSLRHG